MLSGTECPGQTRGVCWVLRTPGRLSCKSSSKIAFSEQAFPLSSSSDFPSGTSFRIRASEYVCPSFTPFADTEWPGYSWLGPTASHQMTQVDFFRTRWDVPGQCALFASHLQRHSSRNAWADVPPLPWRNLREATAPHPAWSLTVGAARKPVPVMAGHQIRCPLCWRPTRPLISMMTCSFVASGAGGQALSPPTMARGA